MPTSAGLSSMTSSRIGSARAGRDAAPGGEERLSQEATVLETTRVSSFQPDRLAIPRDIGDGAVVEVSFDDVRTALSEGEKV